MLLPSEITIIKNAVAQYSPVRIGVFGSYARNEEKPASDIDLLVHFSEPLDLLELVGIEQTLSEKLNRKVEIVTESALSERLRNSVMNDLRPLI